MGLTSWGLLVLLTSLTLGFLAATVWAWPRAAGPGVRAAEARVLLLLGLQFSVLVTLVTALNGYYLFYGSWTDLVRAAGGDSQATRQGPTASANAASATQVVREVRKELAPTSGGRAIPERDGQVEHLSIHGIRTGISAEAYVYLPPQYFQRPLAARRLAVVIFIAGYPAADRLVWISKGHVPNTVLREQQARQIQPMIYVLMRPTVRDGWDTECADVPGGPKVETFFAQDVPEAISETYRAARDRAGWGLVGYSTGGYCATKLAMLHSERFSAAVSMAGHFHALLDTTTHELYGGSAQLRRANDLIWRLRNLPQPPVSILVASADVGEKTFPSAQRFMAAARPPLAVDKGLLPTGGHNFKTFRKYIPPSIRWLSAHLKGE